jgi:hypothetical protein
LKIKNFVFCDISTQNLDKSHELINSLREINLNKGVIQLPDNIFGLKINQEKWPFQNESIDCIINNFYLHNVNNLENVFIRYCESLKLDGCFLSIFIILYNNQCI